MATTGDLTVREATALLRLVWTGDVLDFESERRAIIEVTNGEGELLLPQGRPGPPGQDGEPGPGLAPDVVVNYATDTEAQQALPQQLSDADRGYCVLNDTTKTAFFWSGTAWKLVHNAVGLQGATGPAVGLSIGSVTTSPSGGQAVVSVDPSSTPTNRIINFTLPRGPQGSIGIGVPGPPGAALAQAGDVQLPAELKNGYGLYWNSTIGKWVARNTPAIPTGPYGAGPNEFVTVNDNSWPNDYKQILKLDIPKQAFAWHPRVYAQTDVRLTGIQARVDLEARLNSPTGPVVGRGAGATITALIDNFFPRDVTPSFEAPITPDSLTTYVPADTAASIYLVLKRIDTLATFGITTRRDRANCTVYCDPVVVAG